MHNNYYQKGIGIVITPLKSLQEDQVYGLKKRGINAEYINSSLKQSKRDELEDKIKNGDIDIDIIR